MKLLIHFRILAALHFFTLAGTYFDARRHFCTGSEQFWTLPHLVMMAGFFAGVVFLAALFLQPAIARGHRLLFFTALFLYGGIMLGNASHLLWHEIFDEGALAAHLYFWSPPHALTYLLSIAYLVFFLKLIRNVLPSKNQTRGLLLFLFAILLGVVNFTLLPLWPLGPYGPWASWAAAGIPIFFFAFIFARAWRMTRFPWTATSISAIFLALNSIIMGCGNPVSATPFPSAFFVPLGITVFAFLGAGVLLDLFRHQDRSGRAPLLGFLYGVTYSAILYPVTRWWAETSQHALNITNSDIFFAVASASIGGLLGFWLERKASPSEKPDEPDFSN